MNKYELLAPILILIGIVIPWRNWRKLSPDELLKRIPANRFRGMKGYLDDMTFPCSEFWHDSGGIRGIYQRFLHMAYIVRLLQLHVQSGAVEPEEATKIWDDASEQIRLQIWFSIRAIPEAMLCGVWTGLPHVRALYALRYHYQFSLAVYTVCGSEDASYMNELGNLL